MSNVIEKVEQILYTGGGLNFKIIGSFGKKTSSGNRLDSLFTKDYNSQKYNGIGSLTNITFSPSIYFSFSSFNSDNKTSEEVYYSFPHFESVESFFNESITTLVNEDVYGENDINPNFKELEFISPKLASGKQIKIIPYKIPMEENSNNFIDGVVLFCNDEDHYGMVSLEGLISIYRWIKDFEDNRVSALLLINQLYMYGLITNQNSNVSNNKNNFDNIKPSFNSKSNFGNKFTNKTTSTGIGDKREFKRRSVTRDVSNKSDKVNNNIDNIIDNENNVSNNSISLNDIMTNAEKITDLDIESDIDF